MKNRIFLFPILILPILAQTIDDLVSSENLQTIISNYDKDFSGAEVSKVFSNEMLVFVTPWNRDGMKFTKKYAKKIDYVSPVWLEMKSSTHGQKTVHIGLEGQQNIDEAYIKALKAENPEIKVLPRVYLSAEDKYSMQGLQENGDGVYLDLFSQLLSKVGHVIDGIVFDSPLISYLSMLEVDLLNFLQNLSDLMHENDKLFMTSLMGLNKNSVRKKGDMSKLLKISDKVLICTYDYQDAKGGSTVPISPYDWVKKNINFFPTELELDYELVSRKLMMGIPFYGFKIENGKVGHILGGEYIEILKGSKPTLSWNKETRECEITTRRNSINYKLFYPCLRFLSERLTLFEESGVGAFVWEGGQGLPYFYELL